MRRFSLIAAAAIIIGSALSIFLMKSHANASSVPTETVKFVASVKARRDDLARRISLTAEIKPWQEVDVHAKVAGYLKAISVDIGDRVKMGDTIATLDLPEQERDQEKAKADYNVTKLDFDRIQAIIRKRPGLLAEDEVDKAQAAYEEAKAVYERSKILADYAVIKAPFDGVITNRSVDPGALVQAGTSSAQSLPLVHLAEMDKLRLDFPVSESLIPEMKKGMPVDVTIQATGETIHSSIARMSDRADPATRTMDVEVDLDNPDFHLKPGIYATATLTLDARQNALVVPIQAVGLGAKPNIWVINPEDIVEEHTVTLGIQAPDKVEVTSGIKDGDILVYGNRGDISPGDKVRPKFITETARG